MTCLEVGWERRVCAREQVALLWRLVQRLLMYLLVQHERSWRQLSNWLRRQRVQIGESCALGLGNLHI